MGSLFAGEKYRPLFIDRGRPGLWLAFGLFLAFLLLLPTVRAPDHQAGFVEGLGAVTTIAFWTLVYQAAIGYNRVTRLARIGDTLQVDLRSLPFFPRGFTCATRDAIAWERRGSGLRARLVFYHRGKRYFASLAGHNFLDAQTLVDTYPPLAPAFGLRPAATRPS